MMLTLIPVDHGGIVVMNSVITLSWLVFSFLFWRGLRAAAIEEDRIFDLTFYTTAVAFMAARFGFVITNWDLFSGKSPLLIIALWVSPGLSWIAALIGGIAACVVLSRQYKVRLGLVLDTLATALPLPIILAEAGSLVTGAESGIPAGIPWALRTGADGVMRHAIQLYEMLALILIGAIMFKLNERSLRNKWPYGMVGIWFLLLYASFGFALEFLKEARVYWSTLTANQWVLIGIFAECIGVLYVRGGGREHLRPHVHKSLEFFREKGKKLHESISRRYAR
ncbi:MAG: prolipoprotein diacylglyceryl transferase family protein [Patescibacteria group bacterium]